MRDATQTAPRLDLDEVCAELETLIGHGQIADALAQVRRLLSLLRDRNTHLELEVNRLVRKHLGKTSERVSEAQLSLLKDLLAAAMGEAADADPAVLAPPAVELPPAPPRKKGHGRKPLPPHLPREQREHWVPDEQRPCPLCGGERVCIGHETSETLEFVPASFKVIVDMREKLACPPCGEGVTTAPVPDKVIDKGRPGPGLLAQVMVSKYADHLPLTRQRTIYLREGVELPVSTMVDWVAAFHESVAPLVVRVGELALGSHLLACDDTGIKVLDKDAPGGAKKGHLWCYVGDTTWSVFRYTPDWTKEGPQGFLETRRGWLQADAYRGYDGIFNRPDATAVEVACHAHARRPFAELALLGDARAAPGVAWYQALYAIEDQATLDQVDADERLRRRQEQSAPILDAITEWCHALRGRYPPSDTLAKAAGYVINQNRALRRFLEDGRLPIDNTLVERRLRPIATGRRNYLFCGSDRGAERAASAYTLLGCCALVGLDPRAYLTWLLTQLETQRFPASRLDELLPANWAKVCPESARVPTSR
jgi:transposase